MFRKEEPSIDRHTAVSIVHQIYGVFRNGQPTYVRYVCKINDVMESIV